MPPRRTERAGAKRQTFHGHRERSVQARRAKPSTATERPCGATGEAFTGGVSRRPASPESPASPVRPWVSHGTSQTCLRVQGVFPPAGAWGSAPHPPISQSTKSFVSLAVEGLALWACTVSVVISNYSGSPACGSTPLICNKSVQSAVPHSGSLCALCVPLCPLW